MTAGPCVSLAKTKSITETPSSATHLGGPRRSLTGVLSKAWRRVRHVLEASETSELEDVLVRALADTARRSGGLSALDTITALLQSGIGRGGQVDLGWPQYGPVEYGPATPNDILAWQRGRVLLSTGEIRAEDDLSEIRVAICRSTLQAMAYRDGIDRIAPALVSSSHREIGAMTRWIDQALAGRQIERLARRLSARPDAVGLRAPKRQVKRRSTVDLLNEPIG